MKKSNTLLVLLCILALSSSAQWVADTNVRNVLCNNSSYQYEPRICSDGHHGAIICWQDMRVGHGTLFAQRIDSAGYIQWTSNGIAVTDTLYTFPTFDPEIASDDSGGAYIVFSKDSASSNTHTQLIKLNGNGSIVWGAALPIDMMNDSRIPRIVSDNQGGAILFWHAYVSGPGPQVFVQWVRGDGSLRFPANGLQITSSGQTHYHEHLAYSGDSTLYIAYQEADTLRIVRVDSSGNFTWSTPVTLTNYKDTYEATYAVTCNSVHNAVVYWNDMRSVSPGLYAEEIDAATGNLLWMTNEAVDTSGVSISWITATDDGSTGTFVTYGTTVTRMQHHSQSGAALYSPYLQMCASGQVDPFVFKDGAGGALIVWQDLRGDYGIYAQQVDALGNMLWRSCGAPVFTADNVGSNNDLHAISNYDGTGIAAFLHLNDLYCSRIENIITTGMVQQDADAGISIYPNPSTDEVTVEATLHPVSEIRVSDMTGKVIEKKTGLNSFSMKLSLKDFARGMYLLNVLAGSDNLVRKLVIQ